MLQRTVQTELLRSFYVNRRTACRPAETSSVQPSTHKHTNDSDCEHSGAKY